MLINNKFKAQTLTGKPIKCELYTRIVLWCVLLWLGIDLFYPHWSQFLYWRWHNHTIIPVPANMVEDKNVTTTKQSTSEPCAFLMEILYLFWVRVGHVFFVMRITFYTLFVLAHNGPKIDQFIFTPARKAEVVACVHPSVRLSVHLSVSLSVWPRLSAR